MNWYQKKLQDLRWKDKRMEILNRDNHTCKWCGGNPEDNPGIVLNVHHIYYLAKTEPWDYPNSAFTTCCMDCHQDEELALMDSVERLFKTARTCCVLSHEIDKLNRQIRDLNTDKINELFMVA